jgi:hypothetical protein
MCTYILYLPKYNKPVLKISSASSVTHFHNDRTANNNYIQLHGAFKSVPENKRKAINILINNAALIFLLIFSATALPALTKKINTSLNALFYPHKHCYLNLPALRI